MGAQTKISSARPFFDEESIRKILRDIDSTLRSGWLTGENGPNVKDFEKMFAEYVRTRYAVAVSNGTSALEIPLRYFEVKGREVIVPTNTFVATPNAVLFAGGTPVFADIREDTLCIDLEDVERKVTPKTAGLIVVHVAGLVCPQIDELAKLCRDHKLFLMEDVAHAAGASFNGKMAGTLGDCGCFSFYPTKIMTTGEGGMITTDNSDLAEIAHCMRNHGLNSQRHMIMFGHNWCMSEIAAVIGKHQLEHLERFIIKRNQIAGQYEKALEKVEGVYLFTTPPNIRHSYYKYPIRIGDEIDVEKLAHVLKTKYNIETGSIYYPPCHLHPFYKQNFSIPEGDLQVSERVLKKVLCLPIHVGITEENVRYVTDALINSIGKLKGE